MYLSKSKYTKCVQCNKMLWLDKYKSEVATPIDNKSVLDNGTRVGELAKSLFGEYKDVEYAKQHQTTERIYQFTIDGEELSIKESGIYESNTEYLMDFSYYDGSYLKGDVAHYNSEQYFEFSAAPKKVNVKPVDVSKYHYYEAPQSNL